MNAVRQNLGCFAEQHKASKMRDLAREAEREQDQRFETFALVVGWAFFFALGALTATIWWALA